MWETLDHHKKVIADPSYAELTKLLAPVYTDHIEMVHVDMNGDPKSALSAPITDLTYITLKEGKTQKDLTACFTSYVTAGFALESGTLYGPVIEKPETFCRVVPWESVEVSFVVCDGAVSTSQI